MHQPFPVSIAVRALGSLAFAFIPLTAAETLTPEVSLPLQGDLEPDARGVRKVEFSRKSPATRFDVAAERLTEVEPNVPRFEEYADGSAGMRKGILLETAAINVFRNSSFERGLAGWKSEGKGRAVEAQPVLHGKTTIRIEGSGTMLLAEGLVPVKNGAPKGNYVGVCSFFVNLPGGGPAEGTVRPVVCMAEGDSRGKNLVKDYRLVRMGRGTWGRIVGKFECGKPGATYVAGCQVLKEAVTVDAFQLEVNRLPFTATSYIPTGADPVERDVDVCRVRAAEFPIGRGTLAFRLRVTNPFGRTGYMFAHGPLDSGNRLFFGGGGATLGAANSRWAKRLSDLLDLNAWHLLALTWDGKQAVMYLDGKECGQFEGPFPYEGLREYGGSFVIGSNGNPWGDNGAQGVMADVKVWSTALTAAEIAALWKTGSPDAAATQSAAKRTEIPIAFDLKTQGRVSVGVYDRGGVLKRQLLLGEVRSAGPQTVAWDGRDDQGHLLAAGTYSFRGIANDLTAVWSETVGNSGNPPWGKTAVRGGLFKSVAACRDGVVTMNPLAEGNHGCQRLDSQGRVVWTSEIDPAYAYMTALTADERQVFIAGIVRNETDARGQLYREVIWRLDGETGKIVPWGEKKVIDVNPHRVAPAGRDLFDQYYNGNERYRNPLPGFEVHDLEVRDGKLYVPCFQEGCIRVLDTRTGAVVRTVGGIAQPKGIAVDQNGILVAGEHEIARYGFDGKRTGTPITGLDAPYDVQIVRNGMILVTDLGESQQAKLFSAEGKLERAFGLEHGGRVKDGRLDRLFLPTGVAQDRSGRIVVADFGNGRLVYFTGNGKRAMVTEAAGFGGMDGGVSFLPGDPTALFMSNLFVFGTRINATVVAYRTGARKGTWETSHRWPDITPVFSQEPLCVRRLPNGRTYLYLLARNPSVFELDPEGNLVFCGALLHPLKYGGPGSRAPYMRPEIREDAERLGLLDQDGFWRCRMAWIDANRNGRMERDEVTVCEGETKPFYTVNDASVADDGAVHMKDYLTSTYWKFPLSGFDAAGNPRYDWTTATKIWDLADHPELQGKRWMLVANETDREGNCYFSQLKGDGPCMPEELRLLKFSKDGKLLWNVGRKAKGLKDKPGEFISVTCFSGINRDILYVNEYEGRMDLYTTDGLYLATFLKGVEGEDQYSNWGENFAGDVVEDRQTKEVYFLVNTHNYLLPYYQVKGFDTIQRLAGTAALPSEIRAAMERDGKPETVTTEKVTHCYRLREGAGAGEAREELRRLPAASITFPDERSKTESACLRAGYDGTGLHLLLSIADPTPAVNQCATPSTLWDGDCLELYFSPVMENHNKWRPGDLFVHCAATPEDGKARVGVWRPTEGKEWRSPPEISAVTKRWPDGKGYDLSIDIPYAAGLAPLALGQLFRLDWDVCFGKADGSFGHKLHWSEAGIHGLYSPSCWAAARCVAAPGEETELVLRPARKEPDRWFPSWDTIPFQARIQLEEARDEYAALLKIATDGETLFLGLEAADPTPALVTPSGQWVGTGDFIELLINDKHLYLPASPAFTTAYLVEGGKPREIPGSRNTVTVWPDKRGYRLEVAVPWAGLGGRKERMPFNWRVGWSDASGGSIFTIQEWRPWGAAPVTLRLQP